MEQEPIKKPSATNSGMRPIHNSLEQPSSMKDWFQENRRSVIIAGAAVAIIVGGLVMCNVTCRSLLNESAQKTNPEQSNLAGMALMLAPFCYDSKLLSGISLYRQGEMRESKALLREVLDSDPNNVEALDYHALASFRLADYRSVIEDYDHLLVVKKPCEFSARVYAARGVAKTCLGNHKDALQDLNMAVFEKPHNPSYLTSRAQIYSTLKQYAKSIKDCDLAIDLNPKSADAYLARAMDYRALGKLKQAYDDASKAVSLNPNMSYGHTVIGVYYLEQNKNQLALEAFDKALAVDRNNAWAKDLRSRVLSAKPHEAKHPE